MTPSELAPPHSIVTFYSYKGGVGRSMALANVAVLLAKRGLRVLAVDWDLEAPGLERYFSYFAQTTRSGGLLPFFVRAYEALKANQMPPAYQDFVWEVAISKDCSLNLIPSGRDNHASYAKLLEAFDWPDFFAAGGGEFIEKLCAEWRSAYDVVLVDSRTGMSDAGGICTIQLPDVLVTMFTANEQSMNGVRDIIEAAQRGRQRLAYDRMPLTVLPILCRFASSTEIQESAKWLETLATNFQGVCDDWRPPWVPLRTLFERLKVPQIDFYGFGERLAVIEQGVSDPSGMGYAFDRIADLLASSFDDLEGALGTAARKPPDWASKKERATKESLAPKDAARGSATISVSGSGNLRVSGQEGYEYDIFISYRHGGVVDEWVRRFVDDLNQWLHLTLADKPRIFLDSALVSRGDAWEPAMREGFQRSKMLIAVLTPAYFTSPYCGAQWRAFEARERGGEPLILPILLQAQTGPLPASVNNRMYLKVPEDALVSLGKNAHDVHYARFLQEVANAVVRVLSSTPPYEEWFPMPEPLEMQGEIHPFPRFEG